LRPGKGAKHRDESVAGKVMPVGNEGGGEAAVSHLAPDGVRVDGIIAARRIADGAVLKRRALGTRGPAQLSFDTVNRNM
jgi:hypothetical protein